MTIDIVKEISGADEWQILKELFRLEVSDEALYRPFSTLSGGEQTKALLAATFLRKDGFLLIDEPTNHIDGDTRAVIAAYLKKQSGFLLVRTTGNCWTPVPTIYFLSTAVISRCKAVIFLPGGKMRRGARFPNESRTIGCGRISSV